MATVFFCGIYPEESPHFWWGSGIDLPWRKDYSTLTPDGQYFDFKSIEAEVENIADEILRMAGEKPNPENLGWLTYQSHTLCSSPKSTIQGLSVEVMLSVDRFLKHLCGNRPLLAMPWLCAAYRGVIEATDQSREILTNSADKNSVIALTRHAAWIRHTENRMMKKQVFEWYAENQDKYRSMDAAAEAIAGKIVPVKFRTARAWIAEYCKQVRSARKP